MQHLISTLTIALLTVSWANGQKLPTNTHFSHALETTALPDTIWQLWTDVPNWKLWDDGLKSAVLNGPFAIGSTGILLPDKGPKAHFKLTEVVPGVSYTFRTKLPLGALFVKRYLTSQSGRTTFTHEVWFTGLTKGLFGRALGRRYRAILPTAMTKIKTLAES
ncbi:SRPBCC family protein [Fibrella aquatilis]|uniref:SRPBCC family protein n=1 Tax=Fibrella aquatilis TaxID=2817059 RepID=A0A939K2V1_9BACT|nr:SRPBCC family protein [Fibrella aquatilis]MBO0934466.1 SRPBCC family protein [Fibrella aquatilis]